MELVASVGPAAIFTPSFQNFSKLSGNRSKLTPSRWLEPPTCQLRNQLRALFKVLAVWCVLRIEKNAFTLPIFCRKYSEKADAGAAKSSF